ncbi:AAA family ATPase [uncultured Tenacibaculum sp.]|uniref:AAA family ATPase n=1 Tax=uncultured Tenacibaculum sp. TaxID=174713 RepID=UPI0026085F34|nr:AAA family ATPase [uncultured Tenacibaculum sp.]
MKIKRLWVSKYKNIENIDLEFHSDLVTLLVGRNGLGKSNLIEILALIFRDLDLLNKEDDFKSWAYEPDYFEYIINYECQNNEIIIELKEGSFNVKARLLETKNEKGFKELSFSEFIKNRGEKYLPKYVLGYYSGENKRIKEIISPHEEIQKKRLLNWQKTYASSVRSEKEMGLRRLFFTENYHSQLFLLTLVLFRNKEKFKEKIDDLFKNYLNILEIVNFEIQFNNPDWNYSKIDGVNKGMDYLIENINNKEPVSFPFWNLKGKVDDVLTRFYNHQIEKGSEPISYPNEDEDDRSFVKEFLLFNSINFKDFSSTISEYYEHPIDFFDALEATTIVNILNSITLKVIKKNVEAPISYDQLSEGEQQLLTVLGLILITGNDDCLFLLDEPDTHLNPEWQRDYSKLLADFNLNDKNSHIFVATHSPFIVQSSNESEVILFKKEDNKLIAENFKIYQKNWSINHVLTSPYFDVSARPKEEKMEHFMVRRKEILAKDKMSEDDKEYLKNLEEELGVLPTGETFMDMQMLQFVNKAARKKGYDKTE